MKERQRVAEPLFNNSKNTEIIRLTSRRVLCENVRQIVRERNWYANA